MSRAQRAKPRPCPSLNEARLRGPCPPLPHPPRLQGWFGRIVSLNWLNSKLCIVFVGCAIIYAGSPIPVCMHPCLVRHLQAAGDALCVGFVWVAREGDLWWRSARLPLVRYTALFTQRQPAAHEPRRATSTTPILTRVFSNPYYFTILHTKVTKICAFIVLNVNSRKAPKFYSLPWAPFVNYVSILRKHREAGFGGGGMPRVLPEELRENARIMRQTSASAVNEWWARRSSGRAPRQCGQRGLSAQQRWRAVG